MLDFLKIVGAILGVIAFFWKVYDSLQSYIHIYVEAKQISNNILLVKTNVENKSLIPKTVQNAFLLVGYEHETPLDTFDNIHSEANIVSTNDIADFKSEERLSGDDGRAFVPLPFYYSENIRIADESPSYTASINIANMVRDRPYAVRFFVAGANRLHRSTEDTVVVREMLD